MVTKERRPGTAPWSMTASEWIGRHPVVSEVPPYLQDMLDMSVDVLETRHRRYLAGAPPGGAPPVGYHHPGFVTVDQDYRPDLNFVLVRPDTILVLDGDDALVGGVENGNLWVHPEHRGRGVATAIHVVVVEADLPVMRSPTAYSEGGHATRVAAHRVLCDRAWERGDDVHPEAALDYGLGAPSPGF